MWITGQIGEHALDVGADELDDAFLDHRVGDVDGEDDAGRVRLLRVAAVVFRGHALVGSQTKLWNKTKNTRMVS